MLVDNKFSSVPFSSEVANVVYRFTNALYAEITPVPQSRANVTIDVEVDANC